MAIRVYEYSKKIGVPSKELVALLQAGKFDVATHMSFLSDDALLFLKNKFEKSEPAQDQTPPTASPVRSGTTASKGAAATHAKSSSQPASRKRYAAYNRSATSEDKRRAVEEPVVPKQLIRTALSVAQFSDITLIPVQDIVVTLLKKGIVAPKNYVLSEKIVEELAAHFSLPLLEREKTASLVIERAEAGQEGVRRQPVVVVVGHVDHGKTTLLDYIRKTRVAAREKGGITQQLGAYEAVVGDQIITFLDTPGHEAFELIRVRGITVADIAILVVSADDGVMPQTSESIKRLKDAGIPIIVALNKIDKASREQVESTKRALSQHELIPEEWGGTTIIMPISAKLGTGIAELLDMVVLQSQMMELNAHVERAAKGVILESRMERGRGAVATIICHEGTLRVGDSFIAGSVSGKVSALIDVFGKQIQSVGPSHPVIIMGFDELPEIGILFEVVPAHEVKARKAAVALNQARLKVAAAQNAISLIIRADNMSSKEALINSLNKISQKVYRPFFILHSGIGLITHNDVELASNSKALIYGFNVKVDKDARSLAQRLGVSIFVFDVIYKLLENLELYSEQGRPVKKVLKKVGEATVLKVFDIKGLGVIAGCRVKSGKVVRDGKVVIYRGNFKVGEGQIKSLQRDKKVVKEVATGFECAFSVDGFSDWIVDDRVECFAEEVAT